MPKSKTPTLVFTGGHHTSALATAIQLKSLGWQVVWIGHRHSMWKDTSDSAEYKEVSQAQIPFYDLKAGKFYRNFNPLRLIRIPWGFFQAFKILLFLKSKSEIKGIVSFGGYLAVPVVICGWLLGIPSLTHEQTTVAGYANKLISLFVKKIAVTWPSSLNSYPQHKAVLTGLPLRPEIIKVLHSPKPQKVTPPQILVMGGKQGSHLINECIFASLTDLTSQYQVIHQTGSSSLFNDYQKALELKSPLYHPTEYLLPEQIAQYLQTCDVVVSRAGAHTVYELGVLGKKSVLIPLPKVSHNEQLENAKTLARYQVCVVLPQAYLTPKSLVESISSAQVLTPQPLDLPLNGLEKLTQLIEKTFS